MHGDIGHLFPTPDASMPNVSNVSCLALTRGLPGHSIRRAERRTPSAQMLMRENPDHDNHSVPSCSYRDTRAMHVAVAGSLVGRICEDINRHVLAICTSTSKLTRGPHTPGANRARGYRAGFSDTESANELAQSLSCPHFGHRYEYQLPYVLYKKFLHGWTCFAAVAEIATEKGGSS